MRAPDPEREVAVHAAFRPGELVGQRFGAGGRRIGVRHFEHGGHAAEHGGARTSLQVLFVNVARLAKMDLGIDDAGKNVKAAAIDALARRGLAQGADPGDAPVANADVAKADPVLVDHGPVDEHAIEALRHRLVLSCSGAKAAYLTVSVLASATGDENMSRKAASLADRGVVRVSGEDAAGFLQGLVTNDVERLAAGEARYAALLTPQGKILFDMIVVRVPPTPTARPFCSIARAAQAADLARRLGFYKLRAKVAIADESADQAVAAFWGGEPAAH